MAPLLHQAKRWWRRSLVRGVLLTVTYARHGARVHPAAVVDAPKHLVCIGRRTKVAERCVLSVRSGPGIIVGEAVWLAHGCELDTDTPSGITISAGTSVQRRTTLYGSVHLGSDCHIAPNVFMSSGSHVFDRWPALPIAEQERRAVAADGSLPDQPIVVGDDCWIGVNVVIAPGCTVGRGAVIGANSVVTGDVEPYAVVAGSPARTIRHRLDWVPPATIDATDESSIPYLDGFDLEYGPTLVARFGAGARIALGAGDAITAVIATSSTCEVHLEASSWELPPGRHELSVERADDPIRIGCSIPGAARLLRIDVT